MKSQKQKEEEPSQKEIPAELGESSEAAVGFELVEKNICVYIRFLMCYAHKSRYASLSFQMQKVEELC